MRVWSVTVAGLVAALFGFPSSSAAQAGRGDVQEGNRLYREGRYDEAHERYLEALRSAPGSPLIRFNDANALYQSDEFQRAVDAYRGAIEAGDPALEAQAWYNLGNALYRQQQVEGALDAYKEALRRNPGDTDAKHNLEVALERLQEQERQQQPSDAPEEDSEENQDPQEGEDGARPPPTGGADEQEQSPESQPSEEQPPGEQPPEERPEEQQGQGEQDEGQQPDGEPFEPQAGEAGAEPRSGEMSREEAERLLRAITEDPGRIRRQRRADDPGRRTRRPW